MKKIIFFFAFLYLMFPASAQKTVFRPTEWNNTNHEYYGRLSDSRKYESKNFVLFWGDIVGTNPATYSGADLRFNPQSVADTLETSFKRYIDDLHFINNDPSTNFGKYKTIVMILGTFSGNDDRTTGFAHASSYSNTIGALFVHPSATRDGGALSHEFAHCLQMMMRIQENPGNGNAFAGYDWAGPFFEGHANYMRAMVYPHMADINLTLTRWMQTRHFMWSSSRHHYTNYHVLFYVQEKDGFDFTRRMWAESRNQEHPLQTIRRLKGFTQETLNDYLWGYAARQATFDYPVYWNDQIVPSSNAGRVIRNTHTYIRNVQPRYLSRQFTILTKVEGSADRYYTNDDWAPQDYGMNVIPLYPTCAGVQKKVTVKFKGHTEVNPNHAGWRYGFVTSKSDGTISRYSPMYSAGDGEASFSLNTDTESKIFLIVFSAPKLHENYNMDVGYPKQRRYPYELKIANAVPEGYQPAAEFRSWLKTNGHLHSNGGGWVSNNANVAATVYVGPYAIVRSGTISGNVRIEGHAMVEGGSASGSVVIKGNACVYNATFANNAVIDGNAWMEGGAARDNAVIKGNAFLFSGTYSGTVVVGGDAEIGSCSSGVYLQFPYWRNGRTNCDGKGASDPSNIDINGTLSLFTDAQMNFSSTPSCTDIVTPTYTLSTSVVGTGSVSPTSGNFSSGSIATLTATPGTSSVFSHWSGDATGSTNPLSVTMNANKSIVAHFSAIPIETLMHAVTMVPMTDYTPTSVTLNSVRIGEIFGLTQAQITANFGSTIRYYAINPDGTLDENSTAAAPGHWFTQTGAATAWGANAYVYSELNMTSLVANLGQYPSRVAPGETYTVKQALIYTKSPSEKVQINLVFNITIINSNGAPTDISLSASSINENVPGNSVVGILSSTDPDAGNTFTYTLVSGTGSTDNASFNISGSNLRITNSPDFETKSSYSVRVRTTDQGGLTYEEVFVITITNANELPTDITLSATSINENVPANSVVGILSSTDPDAASTFTYTLVAGTGSADNASFTINGNNLRITGIPDFESKSSYSIRVRTTDQNNLTYEESFIITINDLIETGVSKAYASSQINIYPNPSIGKMTIHADGLSLKEYTIRVTNVLGETVFVDQFNEQLDLQQLPDGVYYLILENEKGTFVKQIIIQ